MALAPALHDASRAVTLGRMFHYLLRPGKALREVRGDFRLPGDVGWHLECGGVVTRNPKPARTSGRVQHVVLTDPLMLTLCRQTWQGWPASRRVLPGTSRDFELWLKWTMGCLALPPSRLTPASWRAGGGDPRVPPRHNC